ADRRYVPDVDARAAAGARSAGPGATAKREAADANDAGPRADDRHGEVAAGGAEKHVARPQRSGRSRQFAVAGGPGMAALATRRSGADERSRAAGDARAARLVLRPVRPLLELPVDESSHGGVWRRH